MRSSTPVILAAVLIMVLAVIAGIFLLGGFQIGTPADTNNTTTNTTATPVPAADQKTWKLTVKSTPAGAEIFVDGESTGKKTQSTLTLDAGEHIITATNDKGGYADPYPVNLTKAQTITLSMLYNVSITSQPAGAALWIDGEDTGTKTPQTVPLTSGKHTIQVKDDNGGSSALNSLTVDKAGELNLKLAYPLEVLSDPPGALIWLDGTYTGYVAPYTFSLDEPVHTIRLTDRSGSSETVEVDLRTTSEISPEIKYKNVNDQDKTGYYLNSSTLAKTGTVVVDTVPRNNLDIYIGSTQINTIISGAKEAGIKGTLQSPYIIGALRSGVQSIRVDTKGGDLAYTTAKTPVLTGIVTTAEYRPGTVSRQNFKVLSDGYKTFQYSLNGKVAPLTAKKGATTEWDSEVSFVAVKSGNDYVTYPYSQVIKNDTGSVTELTVEPREFVSQSVLVTSEPAGAAILVDGFLTGYHTPYTIDGLSDGQHTITVSRMGYFPAEKEIRLGDTAGAVTEVKMGDLEEYSHGTFVVLTDEPGAAVSLYGVATGETTPAVFYNFPTGEVKVTVTTPSKVTKTVTKTVGAGGITPLMITTGYVAPTVTQTPVPTATPEPETTWKLTVLSDPAGSLIYLDDVYLGLTTPATFDAAEGNHTVMVKDIKGNTASSKVSLTKAATVKLDVPNGAGKYGSVLTAAQLSKTGAVALTTYPSTVRLTVDSTNTDSVSRTYTTPMIIPALKAGAHTINASADSAEFGDAVSVRVQTGIAAPLVFQTGDTAYTRYTVTSSDYSGSYYSVDGRIMPTAVRVGSAVTAPAGAEFIVLQYEDEYISVPTQALVTLQSNGRAAITKQTYTTHDVLVTSEPAGASIIVDGFVTGYTTPYTISGLSDGTHRITVSKPGYYPAEKLIRLSASSGTTDVSMGSLTAYPSGYLSIASDPKGAAIWINGVDTGEKTPMIYQAFPAGTWTVKLVFTSGEEKTASVSVSDGKVTELTL